jgi:hypothetical protein
MKIFNIKRTPGEIPLWQEALHLVIAATARFLSTHECCLCVCEHGNAQPFLLVLEKCLLYRKIFLLIF